MKIALAQLNFHVGNFSGNKMKIRQAIEQARSYGAELIIFPELAVCGYPPYDLLEFDGFIEKSFTIINQLAEEYPEIGIIIGTPLKNSHSPGKPLFNSACLLFNGKISAIVNKSLIPDYDVFDEYRYFEPNDHFETVLFKNKKIALTICEDIWNVCYPLYPTNPLDHLIKLKPDFIVNISASPFSYTQNRNRLDVLTLNASKYKLPLLYVNQTGAQTELIFDGGSAVVNSHGAIIEQLPFFTEEIRIIDLDTIDEKKKQPLNPDYQIIPLIHQALLTGIKDYFYKSGLEKAVLGLSGGIDSALTAALLAEALGPDKVCGLLLPSMYSSEHSVNDALQLAKNLGISYEQIPFNPVYDSYIKLLKPYFRNKAEDITEENLQARIRAVILMAYSNKFGHVLVNTSNKSEMAVGYGTLYGDMCGGISVLGDVYKTQVYELAAWINRNSEIIPLNSITKAPSAELKPGQKDTDSLPEYHLLDKVLFEFIENRKDPNQIIQLGYDEKLVLKVVRMVNHSEFKRYQSAPVLRISEKAFGPGRRIPVVAKYDF